MQNEEDLSDEAFVGRIESLVGRRLDGDETRLAIGLRANKSSELIARELQGAVIADPKKIRPEHSDTANE